MIKYLSIPAVLGSCLLASSAVYGQTGKAPCGSFQKLPNGKWSVVRPVKIENAKTSAMINPGTIIGPGTHVLGTDIYAALQKAVISERSAQRGFVKRPKIRHLSIIPFFTPTRWLFSP